MKTIGAAVVLISSFFFGLHSNRIQRQRLCCLREMMQALDLLSSELRTHCPPLYDLLRWTGEHTSGQASVFFTAVVESLSELGRKSFDELWQNAVVYKLQSLDLEEKQELLPLGSQLGRAELDCQLKALERCHDLLNLSRERLETQYREERKLRIGIPVSVGVLITILLY